MPTSRDLFCGVEVHETNLVILGFDPERPKLRAKCLFRRSSSRPFFIFSLQDVTKSVILEYLTACGIPETETKRMLVEFALVLTRIAKCK